MITSRENGIRLRQALVTNVTVNPRKALSRSLFRTFSVMVYPTDSGFRFCMYSKTMHKAIIVRFLKSVYSSKSTPLSLMIL